MKLALAILYNGSYILCIIQVQKLMTEVLLSDNQIVLEHRLVTKKEN